MQHTELVSLQLSELGDNEAYDDVSMTINDT
jgi:hypothetical protein